MRIIWCNRQKYILVTNEDEDWEIISNKKAPTVKLTVGAFSSAF